MASITLQLTQISVANNFVILLLLRKFCATKIWRHTVGGFLVSVDEQQPLAVGDYLIEWVDQFSYLGSVIADEGDIDAGIDKRMANVLEAFGVLCQTVFIDHHLSVSTKCHVYQARVLSTLLYGSECWQLFYHHLKRLDGFHHRCIKTMLGTLTDNNGKSTSYQPQ